MRGCPGPNCSGGRNDTSGNVTEDPCNATTNLSRNGTSPHVSDSICIRPDPSNSKFILAKPAEAIWELLNKIHAKAVLLGAPLLSLTCLGIQRSEPDLSTKDTVAKYRLQNTKANEMAFVSLEASSENVKKAISCRQIFLERYGYSSPEENVRQHAEDVFLYNPNAAKIVQGLGERHWFVFGRSFQCCGAATTVGLLAMGKKVTVLEDAILPAGGECYTSKSFEGPFRIIYRIKVDQIDVLAVVHGAMNIDPKE